MNGFTVVEEFEKALADFAGSKFAVTTNTCTNAIFLSLMYDKHKLAKIPIRCPAKTFISVPMAIKHAGLALELIDVEWAGTYPLQPSLVIDGALRFRRGMYQGGLHCVSFHARKHLNIGEGGAVLTDDEAAAEWLRRARYSGRKSPRFRPEEVTMLAWQMYMVPEKAARGLHLLGYLDDHLPDQVMEYADLRGCEVFRA